jgi:hypothetical protein
MRCDAYVVLLLRSLQDINYLFSCRGLLEEKKVFISDRLTIKEPSFAKKTKPVNRPCRSNSVEKGSAERGALFLTRFEYLVLACSLALPAVWAAVDHTRI